VAILGDQLYAIVAGGGAVHGNPDTPSGVYTIAADGTATLVADLSGWVDAHPVAQTPPEGAKTDGSFFDVAVVDQALWITDAVNGQVLQVTPAGAITRIADLSKGHPVPSGIVADPQGGADVGLLTPAPYQAGTAKVIHLAADGTVNDVWTGLTTVTGLARDADGALYVAELASQTTTTAPYLTPNSGQILRQTGPSTGTVVASGLAFPVDLGVGPDGALYVATPAFGADTGTGQILRLSPSSSTGAAGGTPAAAESGESYGAPAASSPSAASGTAVAATIKNFAYAPNPIEVAVGTKVTWTNDDSTQHTVTGSDQTVIKSPVLNPGDAYSVTFTKPGSYDYHCEFHANMHGTVVVK
jgi:plastocyanin